MPDTYTKTAIVIQGPTAVGKTAIAIALAKYFNTAILSADSRQCYIGMPIGTAQPNQSELKEVKHYFINEYPVTAQLSAADYEQIALGHLNDIFKTNNTATVCGGTGLYIKALCDGMDEMPAINETINVEAEAQYKELGITWLQDSVKAEDPEFYETGEIHNPARLLRALVFIRSTGKSIVYFRTGNKKQRPFKVIKVGLELPREALYERINKRVDVMMDMGLLDEVKSLYEYRECKNLQTVGYSELFDFIDGKCSLKEAIDKIKQHSRNYAKRQMTWFKKDKEIQWFMADDKGLLTHITSIC